MKCVSIVVPIYNSEFYLSKCLESIINQKYKNIEIILINDGSTDNSENICLNFKYKDNRIKYYKIKNHGVSYARNYGIKKSSADYIMFVDSDDLIETDYVEKLITNINDFDIIISGYKVFIEKSKKNFNYRCNDFEGSMIEFCNNIDDYINPPLILSPCFKIFKLDIIKKNNIYFDITINYGEDALFVLDYLDHIEKIKSINYLGYVYLKHTGTSLSSGFKNQMLNNDLLIGKKIDKLLRKNNLFIKSTLVYNEYINNAYVKYVSKLFESDLSLNEKKNKFVESKNIINSNFEKCKSKSAFLIKIVLKYNFLWPILYIFKIKKYF